MKNNNIVDELLKIKAELPKKQKILCDYLLANPQDIGILTVKELALKANVGTTTVMRLTKDLGYQNFSDFRKEFYNLQVDTINKWDDVQKSFSDSSNEDNQLQSINQVWEEGINNLAHSLNANLIENFTNAIQLLNSVRKINIYGARPYKATAQYLELLLGEYMPNVYQLSNDSESVFDKVLQFEKDEVLVLFSFEPYIKRTLEMAKILKEKEVPMILFTDQLSCPLVPFAECILQVEVSRKHYSILPVFALIEAVVLELGKKNSEVSLKKIKELVKTLKESETII